MNAILLIYVLIAASIFSFVSGVFILGGLGWSLIAFSISMVAFTSFLSRGLENE